MNNINLDLLERTAKRIENLRDPKLFDMCSFNGLVHPCGTSHCIGGWICEEGGSTSSDGLAFSYDAQRLGGLNSEQAKYLFYPKDNDGFGGWDATPQQAAAKIRKFIADNKPKNISVVSRFLGWLTRFPD